VSTDREQLKMVFAEHFDCAPDLVVRSPGRVNLIGEHTDYNQGFVLPVAIGFDVAMAASRRDDRRIRLYSVQYDNMVELDLDHLEKGHDSGWARYVAGIFDRFVKDGLAVGGINAAISGDVPLGAGLSSSAALGCAATVGLDALFSTGMTRPQMAQLCLDSEIEYVGLECGIMDQFISVCGKKGHALFLDCRDNNFELVEFPQQPFMLAIANTLCERKLTASEYNQRVHECQEGVERLADLLHRPVTSLRDITFADFEAVQDALPDVIRRRCNHVITENARTLRSVEAFRRGDLAAFGKEMRQSHISLRDDYEVSSAELDLLVELAWGTNGVLGSRMTGGGFGGCTVSLLHPEAEASFRQALCEGYEKEFGRKPEIYICGAENGAEVFWSC
jgi:galactokinase